jgi:hypothetical protein
VPPLITRTVYLEINSVPLATPAWEVGDLTPLLDGADEKGGDRDLPHGTAVAYPRRPRVTVRDVPLAIFGDFDQDGTPHADIDAGFVTNLAYLQANVLGAGTAADGTRPAVLHLPSGTRSADVTVGLALGLSPFDGVAAVGVLRLSIPAGAFA